MIRTKDCFFSLNLDLVATCLILPVFHSLTSGCLKQVRLYYISKISCNGDWLFRLFSEINIFSSKYGNEKTGNFQIFVIFEEDKVQKGYLLNILQAFKAIDFKKSVTKNNTEMIVFRPSSKTPKNSLLLSISSVKYTPIWISENLVNVDRSPTI